MGKIKCVECDMPAEYRDNIADEPLCEMCAKDRAFEEAYNKKDFDSLESMSDEEYAAYAEECKKAEKNFRKT